MHTPRGDSSTLIVSLKRGGGATPAAANSSASVVAPSMAEGGGAQGNHQPRECIIYFGPPLSKSLQELRISQLLDRVPYADRWEIHLIPDSDGFRRATFSAKCQSEEIEVYHAVSHMADTTRLPFSHYSIPGYVPRTENNNSTSANMATEEEKIDDKAEEEKIDDKADTSFDPLAPLPPSKCYYTHTPEKSADTYALLGNDAGEYKYLYIVGKTSFHFPSGISFREQMPSIWQAHREWLLQLSADALTWDLYHNHMMIYSLDLWLRESKYLVLKQELRSLCMRKFLSFAVSQYRIEEQRIILPNNIVDHAHLKECLKSVHSCHHDWLYQDYIIVDKPTYLHFSQVYKRDMYLPAHRHRVFSFQLKQKRENHYKARTALGKEELGDPFH